MIPSIKNIFINLAVRNLDNSIHFFKELGFEFPSLFVDEHASCLTLKEGVYINLIDDNYFKSFTHNDIPDKLTQSEMMLTLVATSKEDTVAFLAKAIELGATEIALDDEIIGVYCRRFMDLDGHVWELLYYDTTVLF